MLEGGAKELSGADSNGQADGVGFAPAEPLGKPDDPVDRPVLLPKKREYLFRSFGVDRSSLPVNPCALDTSPHIAGGDANAGLLRIRFIFPVSESVRTKNSPFSSTNQTGVRTGFPVFRYVSMLMHFWPVNWDNLSPPALYGDCSTVDVVLWDADGVSHTDQNNAVARLGLRPDLALDPVDCSVNSRLDEGCDRGYCFL